MRRIGIVLIVTGLLVPLAHAGQAFYVDAAKGGDENPGTLAAPFRTLRQALGVVNTRAAAGVRSDKIFLRGGVYKEEKPAKQGEGLYQLNLRGTPADHAVLSAMPSEPNAPGAVQRKSGRWYERVVFDDGQVVKGPWEKVPGTAHIWTCKPDFKNSGWIRGDKFVKQRYGYSTRTRPGAQFCVLQDGEALLWANQVTAGSKRLCNLYLNDLESVKALEPGYRAYDVDEATLYVWLHGNKNPNECLIEAWTGLRGRNIFNGDLVHATVRGMEFRLFENVLVPRAKYEEARTLQHVLWEDTDFFYGFRGIMYDIAKYEEEITYTPKFRNVSYRESHHWHIRHNRFYRVSGECLQVMGEGNIVEYNDFIEKAHPCFGPKSWVSCCNWRSCTGLIVRGNYIYGNCPDSKSGGGYTFVFESVPPIALRQGPPPRDGEFIFEYNVFLNNSSTGQRAAVLELGKGTGVFKNMVIRHNIFANSRARNTVGVSTPHENLLIHNNVFYREPCAIGYTGYGKAGDKRKLFGDLPSTVCIKDNIFVGCETTVHEKIAMPKATDRVMIERNLFFECEPLGRSAIAGRDPLFRDPAKLDFRVRPGSPAIAAGDDIGVYDAGGAVPRGGDWWAFAANGLPTVPLSLLP
ncbi:MAG: right-handed parallel beta-helix repeat-containing protein [Kiritimatiellae bacterium]|nr:right-handed parallel beta-helix repeat-containing protein [Kiritimatiellia bacterium]